MCFLFLGCAAPAVSCVLVVCQAFTTWKPAPLFEKKFWLWKTTLNLSRCLKRDCKCFHSSRRWMLDIIHAHGHRELFFMIGNYFSGRDVFLYACYFGATLFSYHNIVFLFYCFVGAGNWWCSKSPSAVASHPIVRYPLVLTYNFVQYTECLYTEVHIPNFNKLGKRIREII